MKKYINQLKNKYGHIIMPLMLIGGFIADIFTLNRIDQVFDNAILITHLLISGTSIALLFSRETSFGEKYLNPKRISWLENAMVFSFGALFSGFVIFYTRSGSLTTTWPFILVMLLLMLGTEFTKQYFYRLRMQIVVYATALISWSIFFIPVISKRISSLMFTLSTITALFLIGIFLFILHKINRQKLHKHIKKIGIAILSIIGLFHLLYFTNILPPIPLSLKYIQSYYEVEYVNGNYYAQYESTPWYSLKKRNDSMYWRPGEDIFVFTKIFAPTDLSTNIVHTWEFYDEPNREWVTRDRINLPITGGRADGYRAFSKKTNLTHGSWRVRVTTTNNLILGNYRFEIAEYGPKLQELVTEEL